MSKIKIVGHASGSGVLTIAAPNTDTDRTITIPDVTGTLLDSGSDLPAANLTGTIADARFPATLPAASGANLTALPAANITGTLPAISATNLTNVPAANITGTLPAVSGANLTGVNAVNAGRKNLILNGSMQVNQRGATSGITSGYFVDRFTLSACSASAVLTSSTPTEFPTAISVSATSGNPIIFQKIESKNCQGLSGKTVTVSFYAKNISNATTLYVKLQYAGSADSFGSSTTISEQNLGSLTSGWVKYTASWTVPAGGLNGLSLGILCAGTGTFTMGVTGVQLEVGSVATDFEHRSIGEELSLCLRYFWRDAAVEGWFFPINPSNNVYFRSEIYFPTIMRSSPSVSVGTTITGTQYITNSHVSLRLNHIASYSTWTGITVSAEL